MDSKLEQGVKQIQALAVQHADELWNLLADADPQTPMEANMLMGAYMGALTSHLEIAHPEGKA